MNEIIVDGKVLCEPLVLDSEISTFNISVLSEEKVLHEDGIYRNLYTYIRVKSATELCSNLVLGKIYRFKGKLSSERYVTKQNKNVFNKIIEIREIEEVTI